MDLQRYNRFLKYLAGFTTARISATAWPCSAIARPALIIGSRQVVLPEIQAEMSYAGEPAEWSIQRWSTFKNYAQIRLTKSGKFTAMRSEQIPQRDALSAAN